MKDNNKREVYRKPIKAIGEFGYSYTCWECKKEMTKEFYMVEAKNEKGEFINFKELFCTKKCFNNFYERQQ